MSSRHRGTIGAVSRVGQHDAGIASALLNTAQQIGGAIGLAALTTYRMPCTRLYNAKHPFAAVAEVIEE